MSAEFDRAVRLELESDITRDFAQLTALRMMGRTEDDPAVANLVDLIDSRLDIYPHGQRPDITTDEAHRRARRPDLALGPVAVRALEGRAA